MQCASSTQAVRQNASFDGVKLVVERRAEVYRASAFGKLGGSQWTEGETGENGGVCEGKRVLVSEILPVGGAEVFMREKNKSAVDV